jgi:hypothetical protein
MRLDKDFCQRRWLGIWRKIEADVKSMPGWMQRVLLDDVEAAVENRVKTLGKAKL